IVALLRSHADILRRLAALEERSAGAGALDPGGEAAAPPLGGGEVTSAQPISGTTLHGDSVTLSFGPGSPVTLIAFLTSGWPGCGWRAHHRRSGAAFGERAGLGGDQPRASQPVSQRIGRSRQPVSEWVGRRRPEPLTPCSCPRSCSWPSPARSAAPGRREDSQ